MPQVLLGTPDGPKIRRLRAVKFGTQQALAAEVGVARSWISHMELGQRNHSLARLALVARALEVDVDEILLDEAA
jgi:transcriptional regulator with XRE-family HTH domain